MFYLINSIPVGIRIGALVLVEIVLIYELVKGKLKSSTSPGVALVKLLIIFDPIYIGIMLYNQYCESNAIQTPSFDWTMVFMIAFVVGLLAIAIVNLVKGNFSEQQKQLIIGGFIIMTIAVVCLIGIEIIEKLGFM